MCGVRAAYGNCNNAAPSPSSSPVPNDNDGRCGAAYYGVKSVLVPVTSTV